MNSEFALYVSFAALAFGAALFAVVIEWLKSDASSAVVEAGLGANTLRRHSFEIGTGGTRTAESREVAKAVEPATTTGAAPARPELIAEDEGALARLCLGWGASGTLLGMAAGAVIWGYVGALLGAVVFSTASIGAVVVAVLILDRMTLSAWNAATKTA